MKHRIILCALCPCEYVLQILSLFIDRAAVTGRPPFTHTAFKWNSIMLQLFHLNISNDCNSFFFSGSTPHCPHYMFVHYLDIIIHYYTHTYIIYVCDVCDFAIEKKRSIGFCERRTHMKKKNLIDTVHKMSAQQKAPINVCGSPASFFFIWSAPEAIAIIWRW